MRSLILGLVLAAGATAPMAAAIRIDGPTGPLGGELLLPDGAAHVVIIVPGSGPTDRNGNSPRAIRTDAYKMVAEGLSAEGIASIRTDKRGMFTSASKHVDPNKVTVADYAADIRAWAVAASERAGSDCAWIMGHSEGGLMALAAARGTPATICGLVLVAAPGRPLGVLLREQLKANPANEPYLERAFEAIDKIERRERPSFRLWELTMKRLFPSAVHDYLIDLFSQDPTILIADNDLPILILQGTRDIQINETDAYALKAARPDTKLVMLSDMTHVLKVVNSDDRAENAATYSDPTLPLHPGLVPAITAFIKADHR